MPQESEGCEGPTQRLPSHHAALAQPHPKLIGCRFSPCASRTPWTCFTRWCAAAASSQDLLTALIMYARLDGGGLLQVRECLGQDRDGFRGVVERLTAAGRELGWPELAIKAARFAGMEAEDRELSRVLACALTQTRWLDSRRLRKDLTRHEPIDFTMLKEMPTAETAMNRPFAPWPIPNAAPVFST